MSHYERHDGRFLHDITDRIGFFSQLAFNPQLQETHMQPFYSFSDGYRLYEKDEVNTIVEQSHFHSKQYEKNSQNPNSVTNHLATYIEQETYFFSQQSELYIPSSVISIKPFFNLLFHELRESQTPFADFSHEAEKILGLILYHEKQLDFPTYKLSIEANGVVYEPESYELTLLFERSPKFIA